MNTILLLLLIVTNNVFSITNNELEKKINDLQNKYTLLETATSNLVNLNNNIQNDLDNTKLTSNDHNNLISDIQSSLSLHKSSIESFDNINNRQIIFISENDDCPEDWTRMSFDDEMHIKIASKIKNKKYKKKEININDMGFRKINIDNNNEDETKEFIVNLCIKNKQ